MIIGSGNTGLSCAIHLAKKHGIKAMVLEANKVAWSGCCPRYGGLDCAARSRQNIYYAIGYGGKGVMYSAQAWQAIGEDGRRQRARYGLTHLFLKLSELWALVAVSAAGTAYDLWLAFLDGLMERGCFV